MYSVAYMYIGRHEELHANNKYIYNTDKQQIVYYVGMKRNRVHSLKSV